MKKHNSRLKKKGAIEMSMQTIIVVVIGVTLLTLGLNFVYNTFTDIGETQDQMADLTEGEIANLFGSGANPVNVQSQLTVKQGGTNSLDVTLVNDGSQELDANLGAEVTPGVEGVTEETVKSWLVYADNPETFNPGNAKKVRVVFQPPKNAVPGNYIITFVFDCDGEYPCGETSSLTLTVTA